jgi:DNA replication ATP-dependent helicase Dna2
MTPAAEVLWAAPTLYATATPRALDTVRAMLSAHGASLNRVQWQAWAAALSRRLQLIWGPPGTGKSRTARAIVTGALLEAALCQRPLRVLVTAPTYNAIDIVLQDTYRDLAALLPPGTDWEAARLRSYLQAPSPHTSAHLDVALKRQGPSPQALDLRARLQRNTGLTLVGAPPEQTHNLLVASEDTTRPAPSAQQELFDLILVDEASQMDVAHAILAFGALAQGGSVVLTGDPMQLAPIHVAEPPRGLESMVGSIYTYLRETFALPDVTLSENYRANATLVDFAIHAGYPTSLVSHSPTLRLRYHTPLPTAEPANWPSSLWWTPEWARLLDPATSAVCFVYPDGRSSQWNAFESGVVCSLVTMLHDYLATRLDGDEPPSATLPDRVAPRDRAYTPTEFWERAVGIVTPHRAQQGHIVAQLQELFSSRGSTVASIRSAVDTVERFQGQQRDVMIASFALGDVDQIREEDEFLMSLNRFNVMASRARAKLVVLVSQELVDHLANDIDTLRASRLLKFYANAYCAPLCPMTLGVKEDGVVRLVAGRWGVHREGAEP